MSTRPRAVVALSGGVDSSVAAALLVEQGYEVIGMMLRLWSEPGSESTNRCCTPDSMALARRVAAQLGIPFYAVDARQAFRDIVVEYFFDGYMQGGTPNPCLVCNRQVRWEFLLNHALALGATHMATGHYARLRQTEEGRFQILKGIDEHKDQSYVLHVLKQEQLSHALFPLGEYTKPQVRELARRFNLPVAQRAESQDLCFLGNEDYRSFLQRYVPQAAEPGPILTTEGELVGEHRGLPFYTIGQRKGLGIAAPHPLYVIEKDLSRNALIIGRDEQLGRSELTAAGVNWQGGEPPKEPMRLQVKIRYKARPTWGLVTPLEGERVHIRFEEPLRDITPGQAAVFYSEDLLLGGGIIERNTP